MDNMEEFIGRRRTELAKRTAALLRDLALDVNIETVERELHRITGTCGTYGLVEGSQGAADLLARVRNDHIGGLAIELHALAEVFTRSSESGEI